MQGTQTRISLQASAVPCHWAIKTDVGPAQKGPKQVHGAACVEWDCAAVHVVFTPG